MGVYVKGAKMPKACNWCEYTACEKRILSWHIERAEDCPLIEIQEPHGKLVDYETIDVDYWEDADGYHISVEAETVIEAEE